MWSSLGAKLVALNINSETRVSSGDDEIIDINKFNEILNDAKRLAIVSLDLSSEEKLYSIEIYLHAAPGIIHQQWWEIRLKIWGAKIIRRTIKEASDAPYVGHGHSHRWSCFVSPVALEPVASQRTSDWSVAAHGYASQESLLVAMKDITPSDRRIHESWPFTGSRHHRAYSRALAKLPINRLQS